MNAIQTTHNLDFEACKWPVDPEAMAFRVGTCEGLYYPKKDSLDILVIKNKKKGNGHLNDVFEWFEYSAKQYKLPLRVLQVWNEGFKKHLIEKRGFKPEGKDDLIKTFK